MDASFNRNEHFGPRGRASMRRARSTRGLGRGPSRGRGRRTAVRRKGCVQPHAQTTPQEQRQQTPQQPCKKESKLRFDKDKVLFQIWCITVLDARIISQLRDRDIASEKDLLNMSLYDLFELVNAIDWQCLGIQQASAAQKMFLDRVQLILAKSSANLVQPHKQLPADADDDDDALPRRGTISAREKTSAVLFCGASTHGPPMRPTRRPRAGCRGRGRGRGAAAPLIIVEPEIGFSVGGARDINSFRDVILEQHRVPSPQSITFEGVFSEYYFDTHHGDHDDDEKEDGAAPLPLFYASYSYATSLVPDALLLANSYAAGADCKTIAQHDVVSDMIAAWEGDDDVDVARADPAQHMEHFLTVGLNSHLKANQFKRKPLNLCVVLDISGSMAMCFRGGRFSAGDTKMRVATQCVFSLLSNLSRDDRFGLVTFDDRASVHTGMQAMHEHRVADLERILDISARGGTNLSAGLRTGLDCFEHAWFDGAYENRVIFITDARPTTGDNDTRSLMQLAQNAAMRDAARSRVYTTFVGVGLDFNCELVAEIGRVRGANYLSVHSVDEFYRRLHAEFEYIVSPMVYDLRLVLQSEGAVDNACIEAVYGSNEVDVRSGEILSIKTLFPSPPNEAGAAKGGIVLIKLRQGAIRQMSKVSIECSFTDNSGKQHRNSKSVQLRSDAGRQSEYYSNMAVRKGILLTRYALLMQAFMGYVGHHKKLKIDARYKRIVKNFKAYFEKEMHCVGDETLNKEIRILQTIENLQTT